MKKFNFVFSLSLLFFAGKMLNANLSKILIIIPAYNCPNFIELQYKTFQKFLKDDYEMVVFNDAKDHDICYQLEAMCQKLNVTCIRIPQTIHDKPYLPRPSSGFTSWNQSPSARNCNVVQYALDTIGFNHNDIVMICENDLFLVKEFSVREYLQGFDLAGFNRAVEFSQATSKGIKFLWIGLILMDMRTMFNKKIFNVNCGYIDGALVDSGGYTHYYLKNNPSARVRYVDKVYTEKFVCNVCKRRKSYRCIHNTNILKKNKFDEETIKFLQEVPIDWGSGLGKVTERRNVEFFLDKKFVHFYGGSGYATFSPYYEFYTFYQDKINAFEAFIANLLSR